jgi:hypothetical protein
MDEKTYLPAGTLVRYWLGFDANDGVYYTPETGIGTIIEVRESYEYSILRYKVLTSGGEILWFYEEEVELYVKDEV